MSGHYYLYLKQSGGCGLFGILVGQLALKGFTPWMKEN